MLQVGTPIRFTVDEASRTQRGTVQSCSKLGARCVVQSRRGESTVIDLRKAEYTVEDSLAAQSSEEAARSGSAGKDEGSEERSGSGSEEPENGDAAVEQNASDENEDNAIERDALEGILHSPARTDAESTPDTFDLDTSKSLAAFWAAADGPSRFRKPSGELAGVTRLATKALYDFIAGAASERAADCEMPTELWVDGFDAEQIWAQLDAAAGPVLRRARKRARKLPPGLRLVDAETDAMLDELMGQFAGGQSAEEDDDASADASSDADGQGTPDSQAGPAGEDSGSGLQSGGEGRLARRPAKRRRPSPGSERDLLPTEDHFLRLDDMERFVQDAEAAAAVTTPENSELSGSSEDDGDSEGASDPEGSDADGSGFASGDADGSGSEDDDPEFARLVEKAAKMAGRSERDAGGIMYEDFFGPRGRRAAERREEKDPDEAFEDADESEESSERASEPADEPGATEADLRDGLAAPTPAMADSPAGAHLSAHERRMLRMAERAHRLEEENLGEKDWYMRGETSAGARPLNSALEIDLDFDRAVPPPPQPTEETTASLEDLIRRRIVDRAFDDPRRRVAAPDTLQREFAKLDDRKAAKGLGEVYEEDYVTAKTGNVLEDKDEKTRAEARLVLKALFAKLDALSHLHFAPKPVIESAATRREVPALAMEEVAPQVVSEAARKVPEEVYMPSKPKGEATTPAERRRSRAAKKRSFKKQKLSKEQERRQREARTDGSAEIAGRKSAAREAAQIAAEKKARKKRKPAADAAPAKVKYTKSAVVFGKIQDERDGKGRAGAKAGTSDAGLSSARLKL